MLIIALVCVDFKATSASTPWYKNEIQMRYNQARQEVTTFANSTLNDITDVTVFLSHRPQYIHIIDRDLRVCAH